MGEKKGLRVGCIQGNVRCGMWEKNEKNGVVYKEMWGLTYWGLMRTGMGLVVYRKTCGHDMQEEMR